MISATMQLLLWHALQPAGCLCECLYQDCRFPAAADSAVLKADILLAPLHPLPPSLDWNEADVYLFHLPACHNLTHKHFVKSGVSIFSHSGELIFEKNKHA